MVAALQAFVQQEIQTDLQAVKAAFAKNPHCALVTLSPWLAEYSASNVVAKRA